VSLRRIIAALVIAVIASAAVFAVLAVVGDWPTVSSALRTFPPGTFALMLVLGVGCFAIRALRWKWLMGLVGYPVPLADALYLHMSGQSMVVTPGRVGEIFKPWLARETHSMPMSRGIGLIFCERVADLLAVCVLSLGGVALLNVGAWGVLLAVGIVAAGVALAQSAWFHRLALSVAARQSWARKHRDSTEALSETVRLGLTWRVLLPSAASSVVAWGLEGLGMYLCVRALGFDGIDLPTTLSAYAVPTLVGAFTFLPGGIGGTEASMAAILVALGMPVSAATVATLLVRVATLWWAVVLGWAALASRPALFRRLFATMASGDDA